MQRHVISQPELLPNATAGNGIDEAPKRSLIVETKHASAIRKRAFTARNARPLRPFPAHETSGAAPCNEGGPYGDNTLRPRRTVVQRHRDPSGIGAGRRHDQGFYAEAQSALPGPNHWTGWLRYGRATGSVQQVDGYLGAGLTGKGLLPHRKDDRLGFAIARATMSPLARRLNGLPAAETAFEASCQYKLSDAFAIQPDVQYLLHSAAVAQAPDALAVGLRLILSLGGPKPAPATDAPEPQPAGP